VLLALLPVTAVVFGFFFLDQTPTLIELFGISLVLGGVIAKVSEASGVSVVSIRKIVEKLTAAGSK
jgi:threonine/homoserine efflux transporter RhtA